MVLAAAKIIRFEVDNYTSSCLLLVRFDSLEIESEIERGIEREIEREREREREREIL